MAGSEVAGVYEKAIDRQSAYEILNSRAQANTAAAANPAQSQISSAPGAAPAGGFLNELGTMLMGTTGPRGGRHPRILEAMVKSGARSAGTQIGSQIVRGVLGSILGGSSRR